MTAGDRFRVRTLRAVTLADRRLLAGTEVEVDACTAAALIREGHARLVDDADLGPLLDCVCPTYRRAA